MIQTKSSLFIVLLLFLAAAAGLLGYLVSPKPYASSDFYAPAITDNGQGQLVKFRVSLLPGNGKTLVNVQNAKYHQDSENALVKAKQNSEELLGIKLSYYDVVLDVEAIGSEVGGESAGAMFTVGIMSAYTGKKIKSNVAMSAGVTEGGLLFAVDSIEEKIIAAKASGKDKFLVATAQQVKNPNGIAGIEIIRVVNVREAAEQMLI